MVLFNELRITEDGKCLVVDCEIEDIVLYSGMYIDSVYIEYYKNASSVSMPSDAAYCIYGDKEEDVPVKAIKLFMHDYELRDTEFKTRTFENGLFYVIVNCSGDPSPKIAEFPCDMGKTIEIGAILDWKAVYERGMHYVSMMFKRCGDQCKMPSGFEQFILLWHALRLAIATCDWDIVSQLWKDIIDIDAYGMENAKITGCGCGK